MPIITITLAARPFNEPSPCADHPDRGMLDACDSMAYRLQLARLHPVPEKLNGRYTVKPGITPLVLLRYCASHEDDYEFADRVSTQLPKHWDQAALSDRLRLKTIFLASKFLAASSGAVKVQELQWLLKCDDCETLEHAQWLEQRLIHFIEVRSGRMSHMPRGFVRERFACHPTTTL